MKIVQFKIEEKIASTSLNEITRISNTDGKIFVAKSCLRINPSYDLGSALLLKEYTLIKEANQPCCINLLEFVEDASGAHIIMDHFNGVTLAELMAENTLDLKAKVKLAKQIAAGLALIHKSKIIHKDINPRNILVSADLNTIKIIDFGISTKLKQEQVSINNANILEGSLPYISPEQTGRMNRNLDYRTDIYSFGITIFELFFKTGPFPKSQTPLEMAYAHLSLIPEQFTNSDYNSKLPKFLENIIKKCMEKEPDKRYQSFSGIEADLNILEDTLEANISTTHLDSKQPGTKDVPSFFRISQKIYGRDKEISTLQNVIDQCLADNKSRFISLSGVSGIGKSFLVKSLFRNASNKNVIFTSSKFDQFTKAIPFAAIKQAFKEYIEYYLRFPKKEVDALAKKIKTELDKLCADIISIIPEFSLILTDTPAATEFDPRKSIIAIERMMKVVATKERPICFFIDDLQWGDSATLDWIYNVITGSSQNIVIIGAYRSNEVDGAHPYSFVLKQLKEEKDKVTEINLTDISKNHIQQMISDTFFSEEVEELSNIVLQKTGGTPFYIHETLEKMNRENLVFFDPQESKWKWDIAAINKISASMNMIEILKERTNLLPKETMKVLACAAMLGTKFSISDLSWAYRKNPRDIIKDLWQAVLDGMLSCIQGDADPAFRGSKEKTDLIYQFSHDKIQKICKDNLHKDAEIEYRINYLKGIFQEEEIANFSLTKIEKNKIVFTCSYINWIEENKPNTFSKSLMGEANKKAVDECLKNAAFASVEIFAKKAIESIDKTKNFEDFFDTSISLSESYYLSKKYNECSEVLANLRKEKLPSDKLDFLVIKQMRTFTTTGETLRAKEPIFNFYRRHIAYAPDFLINIRALIQANICAFKVLFFDIGEKLSDEKMSKYHVTLNWFFGNAVIALYTYSPLFPFHIFSIMGSRSFKKVLPKGQIAGLYAGLSLLSLYGLGKFAKKRMEVVDRLAKSEPEVDIYVLAAVTFVWNWLKNDPDFVMEYGKEFVKLSANEGNFLFIDMAIDHMVVEVPYHQSGNINKLAKSLTIIEDYINYINPVILGTVALSKICVQRMQEPSFDESGKLLTLDEFITKHSEKRIAKYISEGYKSNFFCSGMMRGYHALHHAILGDFELAFEKGECNLLQLLTILGFTSFYQNLFLQSLTFGRIKDKLSFKNKAKLATKRVITNIFLKIWTYTNLERFGSYLYMLKGEKYSGKLNVNKALKNYKKSIDLASKISLNWLIGMANEAAADLLIKIGDSKSALGYILASIEAYQNYGAGLKIYLLKKKYAEFLAKDFTSFAVKDNFKRNEKSTYATVHSVTSHYLPQMTTNSTTGGLQLDFLAIVEASQSIASQVKLDGILAKLVQTLTEIAGADRILVITKNESSYEVTLAKENMESSAKSLKEPLENTVRLPENIINLVLAKKESVIINEIGQIQQFCSPNYLNTYHAKSILSMPVINKGKIVCILYMENSKLENAFTQDRISGLKVVSGQLAISIENANLYDNLEKKVQERTAQLFEKTKEIHTIFSNLQQGIFIFDQDLKIGVEYSNYLATLFPNEQLDGAIYSELIFKNCNLGSDLIAQAISAAECSMGMKIEFFALNSHLLPRELIYSGGHSKIVDLDWQPITDETGNVIKIMVVIRDVTQLKKLQSEAGEQKRTLSMIGEILKIKVSNFQEFFSSAIDYLNECEKILSLDAHSEIHINKLMRNIHTVKGNARTLGLSFAVDKIHETEASFENLRNNSDSWEKDKLFALIADSKEVITRYQKVIEENLSDLLDKKANKRNPTSIQEIADKEFSSLGSIATELGKPTPKAVFKGKNIILEKNYATIVRDSLGHCLKNSIAHGLESAAERAAAGKNTEGTIIIQVQEQGENVEILVYDDGRGLNLQAIRKKGIDNNLLKETASDEEIADCIFKSGLSTAEKLTSISGRGVGLDAVRSFIEENGGMVKVKFMGNKDIKNFRPFAISINFPKRLLNLEKSA